jgi:hypothetical protein
MSIEKNICSADGTQSRIHCAPYILFFVIDQLHVYIYIYINCLKCWSAHSSHLRGQSLSCSVALVARNGVRYIACVGSCDRAVSDYSGKFPQFIHLKVLTDLNDRHTVMLIVLRPSLLVGTSYNR